MKKLLALVLAAMLSLTLVVTASAELYNPHYYGIVKVETAPAVDGAVDACYGDPIAFYQADGLDDPGDHKNSSNWFYTTSNSDDILFIIDNVENFAKVYAVWTDTALYVCIDTNIQGWKVDGVAEDGSNMWQTYCAQLGLFDFKGSFNTDFGMGINPNGDTVQYSWGGVNQGSGTPVMAIGPASENVSVSREGEHIVYEVELPYDHFLSFTPTVGDCIGMDVCVNFGELVDGVCTQQALTFTNAGYHQRSHATARHLYFVNAKADADAAYANEVNGSEVASDAHSISLFGCNEAFGSFTVDTENAQKGYGCISTYVGKGFVNSKKFDTPIDGTGYDTLEFDFYVSDASLFNKLDVFADTHLELTSSGKEDNGEIGWTFAGIQENNENGVILAGWNHVVLPLSTAVIDERATDAFDQSAINFMRIFLYNASEEVDITVKFDNIRLTDAQAQKVASMKKEAADVEAKIAKIEEITADNLTSMKTKVSSARKAYDKLTEDEKAYVSADNLKKLTDAEAKIAELESPTPTANPTAEPTGEGDVSATPTEAPGDDSDDKTGSVGIIIAVIAVVVIAALVCVYFFVIKKKKK